MGCIGLEKEIIVIKKKKKKKKRLPQPKGVMLDYM
jgi:hypothetical protein